MSTAAPGRRGRRPGSPDTKAAILVAARASFASMGLAGTTIRAVAREAGVDAALVHHFFGSKDDLYLAALELPVDPRQVLAPVVAAGPDGVGERLLGALLGVWDDPQVQPALLAMLRGVLSPDGHDLLARGFLDGIVMPTLEPLAVDRHAERVGSVASQFIGLMVARYLLRLEPLASMPADQVVRLVGPTVQRYLTGPLETGPCETGPCETGPFEA